MATSKAIAKKLCTKSEYEIVEAIFNTKKTRCPFFEPNKK